MGDQTGSFAGGLAQGLGQALTFRQQQQRQAEDLALKKKALKLEEDKQKLQQEVAARNAALVMQILPRLSGLLGAGEAQPGLLGEPGPPAAGPAPDVGLGMAGEAPAVPGPQAAPPVGLGLGAPIGGPPAPAPTVAGPSAAPTPAPPPRAPMRFVPGIALTAEGPRVTFNGQLTPFRVETQPIVDPATGRAVLVRDYIDPVDARVVRREILGPPKEAEALERASAIVEAMGASRDDPNHPFFRGEYLRILDNTQAGPERQLALADLQRRIETRPQTVAGVAARDVPARDVPADLTTFGEQARGIEVAQEERKTRARERAQREETRLTGEIERRVVLLQSFESQMKEVRGIVEANPGLVGKPFAPSFRRIFGEEVENARKGKYVGNALGSRLRQFFGTANAEEVTLFRGLAQAADTYLRAVTGATAPTAEQVKIERFLASVTDEPRTLLAAIDRVLSAVNTDILNALESQVKSPAEQLRQRQESGGAAPAPGAAAARSARRPAVFTPNQAGTAQVILSGLRAGRMTGEQAVNVLVKAGIEEAIAQQFVQDVLEEAAGHAPAQ